jgi:hypothetical protein
LDPEAAGALDVTLLLRYQVELENPALVLGTKEFTILKSFETYNAVLRGKKELAVQ